MVRISSARAKSCGVTGKDVGSNCLENAIIQTLESSNEGGKGNTRSIIGLFKKRRFSNGV